MVARKVGNATGAMGPCCSAVPLATRGGRGALTTAPVRLQDLRQRIYDTAKADTTKRFWGPPHDAGEETGGLRLDTVE